MKKNYMKDYTAYAVCGILFFLLYIIQYSDILSPQAARGFPQFMLIATVFSGMFWKDKSGAIFGFFAGAMVDAVSSDVVCFNTIFMLLCGYLSGVLVEKIVNNNFRAAFIMMLTGAVIYYFFKWMILGFDTHIFKTVIFRSVVLTMLFSIPLYGFMFLVNNKLFKQQN